MRILVTGQCTLHWGRLEFGNIGNYYIIEPTVRELHRVFPEAEIVTTFQFSDEFCQRERITCLPMELFYSWSEDDLKNSLAELGAAQIFHETGKLVTGTPYIEEVQNSDLIIDFSGEMWGDHAEPVGKNRFLVGLIKDRIAQLFNKPVVLLAGSQGPFSEENTREFAKIVFRNFYLVANREATSYDLLKEYGFDVSKVKNFACPAFLFEAKADSEMNDIYIKEKLHDPLKKTIGYVLCGFNFVDGPYDKTPREDEEFEAFAESIEFMVNNLGARVVLLSHQNGFSLPPHFKLINGRDYPIIKQLHEMVLKRGKIKNMNDVLCIENPYLPNETKAIIGQFDMFVSGRVHGFVASVSQAIPTVLITRGQGGRSHRNIGFAKNVGLEMYIADPHSSMDMIQKICECWNNRENLREELTIRIPEVQETARKCFDEVGKIF
jgi:colanic acid/amylovoran biosynthesis protein